MENHSELKFLAQSYQDALSDYATALTTQKAARWDWVVITAADQAQADVFQMQLDRRKMENLLVPGTRYAVVPDTGGKRIGSGGATLNVLRYIGEKTGIEEVSKLKVLVCHSGGDSKRIPQYSVCGKLFTPVPRQLENGRPSTIFDELMILSASIPARVGSGMMIMPSDTMILFNPVQVDLFSCDAAGLSIKADISTGQEHGVFLGDENNLVTQFLHKQSKKNLQTAGAVDMANNVNIDTGCIWFGQGIIEALTGLISKDGTFDDDLFRQYVNEKVCLSFYADFLFPLATEATLADYLNETPENVLSDDLRVCRHEIWRALHDFKLSLARLHPAKYIHFGTMREFFDLLVWHMDEYSYLGWKRQIKCTANTEAVVNNSSIHEDTLLPHNCYIENCDIRGGCTIGGSTILSGVAAENLQVPEKTLLHCLKLKNGKFVCRILGLNDNPKNSILDNFLTSSVSDIFAKANVPAHESHDGSPSIWEARLYPECKTAELAAESALALWRISSGQASEEEIAEFNNAKRHSLKSSFNEADAEAMLDWNKHMTHYINTRGFVHALRRGTTLRDALPIIEYGGDSDTELHTLLTEAKNAPFPLNMRLYHALSVVCQKYGRTVGDLDFSSLEDMAYESVKNVIVPAVMEKHKVKSLRFLRDSESIELPVRVNFCGSPSDAAPYCLEHGGTMFDGALLLNGKHPIRAEVTRLEKRHVILESIDLCAKLDFEDIGEIRACGNPFDTFALHKAVLVAAGVVSVEDDGSTLEAVLEKIGGGFMLTTFADVPKGSGLGTSSIVAAACLKAINAIFGQDVSDERIHAQVFAAEQLMNTGGGWQDQVGGLAPGLKLMQSEPGNYQKIDIQSANLSPLCMEELNARFALVFSGQRRLARNVLREELNRCIENDKTAHQALDRIRSLCVLMKFELERGNITRFAHYITEQFELVKTIDKGASNTYIEYIFEVCDDLIDGKSICGAGGGGFLQMILKRGVSKATLQKRLEKDFGDCGVKLWECELI